MLQQALHGIVLVSIHIIQHKNISAEILRSEMFMIIKYNLVNRTMKKSGIIRTFTFIFYFSFAFHADAVIIVIKINYFK